MQTEPIEFKKRLIKRLSVFINSDNISFNELKAELIKEIEANNKMAIALQKIEQHIDDSGLKMVDLENPLQVALYHIKHLSKEALKEAGL